MRPAWKGEGTVSFIDAQQAQTNLVHYLEQAAPRWDDYCVQGEPATRVPSVAAGFQPAEFFAKKGDRTARPGKRHELPANWHAGLHLGPERKSKSFSPLRARRDLPASLPPKGSGPVFSKFFDCFPHFALDHTRGHVRNRRQAAGMGCQPAPVSTPDGRRHPAVSWQAAWEAFLLAPQGVSVSSHASATPVPTPYLPTGATRPM